MKQGTLRQTLRGFSLVELMVALTLGLIISIAAISAYVGASSASKVADAQTRMNEDAQAALSLIAQQLRMAGNNPKRANRVEGSTTTLSSLRNPMYLPTPTYAGFSLSPGTFTLSGFRFVRGCDGAFSNLTAAADIDSLTCAGTTTTLPDSIAITYEADQYNTIPTSGGTPTDCLGGSLPVITASMPVVSGTGTVTSSVTYYKADNRFYIGTSSAIVNPSLYCKGNGTPSPQPMVENVEDMQITYGTLNTTGTSTGVAGYLEANEITSVANLAALANDAARWKKVITARICIVVRSETTVVSDASSAKYLNCQGSLVASPDLRLRKAYSTTVELRN